MTAPRPWVLATAVVVLAIVVYLPAFSGGWIYDDHILIPNNPHVHSLAEWRWWLGHDFWNTDAESVRIAGRITYWRPLVSASYAVDWQVGGGSPAMFHLTNLLAHAVVALLAFFALRRWVGSLVPAALAAALFAIHPTKTESVAWISGRTDVLCMIAMLIAIEGIARRMRGKKGGIPLEIIGTVGAYLCKEQAIVLPVFALVELWVFLEKPAIDSAFVKRSVRAVAPQIGVAVAYLVMRAIVLPVRSAAVAPPPVDHLLAILDSLGRYIALTFAPVKLTIQEGLTYSLSRPAHDTMYVALGALALAGGAALAFGFRKRWPALTLGLIVFGITIAPTVNIIYTGLATLVADRFLYLPMIGVALIAGDAIVRANEPRRSLVAGALAIVIALFSIQAARRSADYADEETFWTHEIAMNPDSRDARDFLAAAAVRAHHYQFALRELLALKGKVRDIDLGLDFALNIAELVAQTIPDLATDELRAVDSFAQHVLDRDAPVATLDVRGVGLSVATSGKLMDAGVDRLSIRFWTLRALLATRMQRNPEARQFIERAHASCPTCASVVTNRALVLARVGDIEGGLESLTAAQGALTDETLAPMRTRLEQARVHRDRALDANGPAAVQESALELSTLELWGAAYNLMAPHKEEIERAPGVAMGFAELAFRAGATDVAREVLATQIPPDQIDSTLQGWGEAMGWLL